MFTLYAFELKANNAEVVYKMLELPGYELRSFSSSELVKQIGNFLTLNEPTCQPLLFYIYISYLTQSNLALPSQTFYAIKNSYLVLTKHSSSKLDHYFLSNIRAVAKQPEIPAQTKRFQKHQSNFYRSPVSDERKKLEKFRHDLIENYFWNHSIQKNFLTKSFSNWDSRFLPGTKKTQW